MNLAPLAPFAAMLGTQLVLALFGSNKHWIVDGNPTYRWPKGYAYFILVGTYVLVLMLGFGPQSPAEDSADDWIVLLAIMAFGTSMFIYFIRFRVVLDKFVIRSGAFFFKEIRYSDVVRVKYIQGRRSGQVILCTGSGRQINVWETIGDFASCVREIEARLPAGVLIPRNGRMATYLGEREGGLSAKVAESAAHLRAQLSEERAKEHSK